MQILVLNTGSSSVKYQIVDPERATALLEGQLERVGEAQSHLEAFEQVAGAARKHELTAVGHRVVHGGERFSAPALIDDSVIAAIEACVPLAPLHNPSNLAGIRAARRLWPGLPQVAVFDTAFHAKLPRRARTYAIPPALAAEHGIRRYGFHGTSHAYVAERAARALERPLGELRLVTLHLGNGASACAVEYGHSTETSMGMTPLEGLVMGTRAGDLDPGAVLALLRSGLDVDAVDRILNHESGLAGLGGVGMDLRDIEARAAEGDDRCRLAISVFSHRVKKYVGAYAATMGGLDAIVLTGGIGENSVSMRRRILQRLDFLGLSFDEDRNRSVRLDSTTDVARVSRDASRVAALVVNTNEERMIALETAAIVAERTRVDNPAPIPIAVSARHVHLDAETFAKLFGPSATPTHYRDLSQPGQFACEEQVSLIGPRGRLERVRFLGPFRSANQVEISRTDEFLLGVDAPVRDSGKTRGSAPVTLEGPAGTVRLSEGLICAKRHIHMTPADAAAYHVSDGDEVEVAISGGPRELVFGGVLIRVSPNYRLEMHIDTDEGNAAELDRGAEGALVYTPATSGATASLRARRRTPE
ncbi:MAG: acetate/propionate family kinase [Sorangiineae bacterium]|nr:acetate/propionate family kinase [Polyangiaceae bacterium]MEB2321337.1 acetate/propionate family kinase [Sorangiineae bacterium]